MEDTDKKCNIIGLSIDGVYKILSTLHINRYILGIREVGQYTDEIIESGLFAPEMLYQHGKPIMAILLDNETEARYKFSDLAEQGIGLCLCHNGEILITNFDLYDDPLWDFREQFDEGVADELEVSE
ncbi:MAG: hypothetical protein JEY94_19180 [Melioribacteraceae bacterium]|nr:hypothetical protein [Melioribacteraceae bacterium]